MGNVNENNLNVSYENNLPQNTMVQPETDTFQRSKSSRCTSEC